MGMSHKQNDANSPCIDNRKFKEPFAAFYRIPALLVTKAFLPARNSSKHSSATSISSIERNSPIIALQRYLA